MTQQLVGWNPPTSLPPKLPLEMVEEVDTDEEEDDNPNLSTVAASDFCWINHFIIVVVRKIC